ncbi:hypothetical protein KM043_005498 [Ampulex compressa]|nr:hypothetical protein KM043_005498 [Ampulex compressa]
MHARIIVPEFTALSRYLDWHFEARVQNIRRRGSTTALAFPPVAETCALVYSAGFGQAGRSIRLETERIPASLLAIVKIPGSMFVNSYFSVQESLTEVGVAGIEDP